MSKSIQAFTWTIGALTGLLVLAAITLLFILDTRAIKPRIERAVSEVLGMEVKVNGRLGIGFFPGLRVTLNDVHIRNRGTTIVIARQARVGVNFIPLLDKNVRINQVVLDHPRILIVKDREGRFNFEQLEGVQKPLSDLSLASISVTGGTFHYVDQQTRAELKTADCGLEVSHFQLTGRGRPGIMNQLSLAADLVCGVVQTQDYVASDLRLTVVGQRGIFDLNPLTMRAYAGQGSGTVQADFTGDIPRYQLRYTLSQFSIETFLKNLPTQQSVEGPMDFSANLSMQGKTMNSLRQTSEGHLSLRGKNLILNGRNLDQEFARFETSQRFNLVDVGALLLAGPVGLVVTKGYNFASILQGSEGRSTIRTIVSDWKVERGVALAQDVAMSTDQNRLALQGRLDFVNKRFKGVNVALIDDKGCIQAQQTVHGAFKQPVIEKPSVITSLSGPVVSLLKPVKALFPGGGCKVFYTGSVASPK
ncbi:MAG TPA: AsmA family protein [Thiobacillus sp.]